MNPLEFYSESLRGVRRLWWQPASEGFSPHCCIVLDAELYRDRMGAPQIVDRWRASDDAPPTTFVYVSAESAAARHQDFACSSDYGVFLVHELLPWLNRRLGGGCTYWLMGLSLSGLAAAFTVWRFPTAFAGAICQSPSAWWNDEWLSQAILPDSTIFGRFWVSVGELEREADLRHPPTDMYQGVCQWDSVCRLAERLAAAKGEVHLHAYHGGHDPASWAEELPRALSWLLNR